MNEDKIDFSCLDPSTDGKYWEDRILRIVRAAQTRRDNRMSLWGQLVAWAKPALVTAAAAALLCLSGAFAIAWTDSKLESTVHSEPSLALAGWAAGQEQPSTAQILQVLGGDDGQE